MHQRWCVYNRTDHENSEAVIAKTSSETCPQKDKSAARKKLGDDKTAPGKRTGLAFY